MSLNRSVRWYIVIVTALAAFAVGVASRDLAGWDWQNLTLWSLVCVLAELLWLKTISGQGTVSMASTFNLAVIYLLGWEKALWVVGSSTLFANLAIQKKEWYKALFNTSQSILATAAGGLVFIWAGGRMLLPETTMSSAVQIADFLSSFHDARLIVPFLASMTLLHMTNTLLVSGVIALVTGAPLLQAWRQNYGYSEEIVSSLALLLLAPLVVLSYGAVSFLGLVLFFVPLVFVRDATMRYMQLQKAQDSLIRAERMAAKGEMAAEIGHELNNYLAAVSGRAQMILMAVPPDADPKLVKSAQIIYENTSNMAALTAGLMSAAHKETQRRPSRINDLINKTVEFVRPQNRFDGIHFDMDLDDSLPVSDLDPGQIQQVILNLFANAADALAEANPENKVIRVRTHHDPEKRQMVITVSDNGCGMAPEVAARIFEPTFTTKEKGHGFGLSTSYRIIENHSGRITVDSHPGDGATFTVQLPLKAA